ncbi:MAG: hypothetical protein WC596_01575 [Candidatus Shapirobacteria bacterium]
MRPKLKPKHFTLFPYLSLFSWFVFLAILTFIPPTSLFIQISAFLVLFCAILSTIYVFSHRFKINLLLSFYFISLPILFIFHQLTLLNFLLLTALFTSLFFVIK